MRLRQVKARIEHQRSLISLIETAVDNLNKVGELNVTPQRVDARLTSLKEIWKQFSLQHQDILLDYSELSRSDRSRLQKNSYFSDNLHSSTHERYVEAVEQMTSRLESEPEQMASSHSACSATPTSGTSALIHHARLPRIDLPKFDGSPADWLSFKDMFNSFVLINPSLTSVEKLQYLKTSLVGKAAPMLKNTTLTGNHFQAAWEALTSYYENERLLVNSAVHSLFTLNKIKRESAYELEQLYTNLMQIYHADSVKAWENHLGSSTKSPSWNQLSEFLVTRMRALQAFENAGGKNSVSSRSYRAPIRSHFQGKPREPITTSSNVCSICSAKHYIAFCPRYLSKTIPQRIAIITKQKLCYNCLGSHRSSACRIVKRCVKCGRKHHTSIHQARNHPTNSVHEKAEIKAPVAGPSTPAKATVLHTIRRAISCVLLATAQVYVIAPNGKFVKARALIDQGSEISLISERLVQALQLQRRSVSVQLVGIGAQRANKTKGIASLKLKPHFNNKVELSVSAYILPKLTTQLPSVKSDSTSWTHLSNLLLADPDFCEPGSIELILGADVYGHIIEEGIVKGQADSPIAQRTKLGWIVSGPSSYDNVDQTAQSYHVSLDRELYKLIQRFWELEEIPSSSSSTLSKDEQSCENHFVTTHTREETGRYQLRLPFKLPANKLGNSKIKATRIMTNLSKKLTTDSTYAESYSDFMNEYRRLSHMKVVPDSTPEPEQGYYLPHHGVLRETSLTTKIRVVFNGSSPTTTGHSLNDLLHTGAKLQRDLYDVLLWFRQFRYVFSSDMEKMYRQINVHPDDWNFQRILWTEPSGTLQVYQLTTVTYGLACAPFQALRTLQQLIVDEGKSFPLAIPTLTKGRYVDDVFGGADSVPQAQEIVRQVNNLCKTGGFPLHKWTTNAPEILASIPADKKISSSSVTIDEHQTIHALGLIWTPTLDTFNFTLRLPPSKIKTKRSILSIIAKLFDPLGFLSPVIITAKILIQELWAIKLNWDDPLPSPVSLKWNKFEKQLQEMPDLAFPRWVGLLSNSTVEIHGFCDASQHAMAAAVYVRTLSPDGVVTTNLLCAKTKVAPLKRLTIPRLELSGAHLLSKLVSHAVHVLQCENASVFLWTDSAVALTWINNHPSRWKEFVHNRVCSIQEILPQAVWKFIPGKHNPADYATRGLSPAQLAEIHDWWYGPSWLSQPRSAWPNEPLPSSNHDHLEERTMNVTTITKENPPKIWNLVSRYSSLKRLLRITATCQRVIARFRRTADSLTVTPLTTQELENAQTFWVRTIQLGYFRQELEILSKGLVLPRSNHLLRLTPFIDSHGLLRVGGRLHFSLLPPNAKHPLILPKVSALSTLIISEAHSRTLHGGTQITTAFIRNNYWIIGGRAPIRSFILKCVRCARFQQQKAQQLMGNLPVERLTPSRPFLNSGVDYAGPFILKTWRGKNARTYKGYIALFVCHATSAIHLELVTEYSTEAFLAAYRRFTSRRGICATLMSDCGTNFVGADSELQALFSSASEESRQLATLLANDGTQWKFIPPASPHFGGKWEAGVRSVKFHLRRVVGDSQLTYEEMSTLLTQIEATLNSRPLCPITDDPEDLSALTPGHFIMGSVPTIIPEPSLLDVKISRLSRWQLIRQMLESFWTRWSSECLQRYLSVYKWNRPVPSLVIGSLVLVVDERYPPSKWPLGRIIKTHPGTDGHTRVVTVRTQTSVLKRSIAKVCPLPIQSETV